jgi:outer membrane lipoprotein SlyB
MTTSKILVIAVFAALAGCQSTDSARAYDARATGKVNQAVAARIVSVRPVTTVANTDGMTAGLVAGAAIGSQSRGSTKARVAAGLAGATIGALAGAGIDAAASDAEPQLEYVLQTDTRALITLVQGALPAFAVDDKVLVLYGPRARIIADPRP